VRPIAPCGYHVKVDKVKEYPLVFTYFRNLLFIKPSLCFKKAAIFPLQLHVNLHLGTKLWLVNPHPQRDLAMKSHQHLVGVSMRIGGGSSAAYKVKKADSYPASLTEKNLPT